MLILGAANLTSLSFTHAGLSPDTAYLYKVRAINASGKSDFSPPGMATTVAFSDDPLAAGTTTVKALHVAELRRAVNAVRLSAGVSAATFTDPSLGGVKIKTVHIIELRSGLDEAMGVLGFATGGYSNPILTATSTLVKAIHVQEIRNRVK